MDPITAAEVASELAGLFVTIVKAIKEVIETMKGAKKGLIQLLNRSERMRLILELFRSLTSRLREPTQRSMTLTFDDAACRQTATDIYNLVHKVAGAAKHSDLWMKFNWVWYKGEATGLIDKLEVQERDLNSVLMFIAAQSSVTTEQEVLSLKVHVVERSRVADAFDTIHLNEAVDEISLSSPLPQEPPEFPHDVEAESLNDGEEPSSDENSIPPPVTTPRPALWLGNVLRTGFGASYLHERDKLADAAYWGDWDTVLENLETGQQLYDESWSNAARLKPEVEAHRVSGWTALHQAAYLCAPLDVVEKLINLGAFKTLPTRWTNNEFVYADMTAADIAHELSFSHLYGILAPVIRHHIPARTLVDLQDQFHRLIRAELEDGVGPVQHLRLPELVVLTELDDPEMWFPIQTGTQQGRGFLFRLDGRELLVLSVGGAAQASRQLFRIAATGWSAIEDAIIFSS